MNTEKKPCKFAHDGGNGWECGVWRDTECAEQKRDYNPDGSVNCVMCILEEERWINTKN